MRLMRYIPSFREARVDGIFLTSCTKYAKLGKFEEKIMIVSREELKELGVVIGHRRMILENVQLLLSSDRGNSPII